MPATKDRTRTRIEVPKHRRPALFLDRDGVLNHDHGYVHRFEDFHWIDGAREAVKLANDLGWYVIVVTNQAGIARGYYPEEAVVALHDRMQQDLQTLGAHVDAFYFCPHHPEGAVPDLSVACSCRKPQPGMLQAALRDWPIDASRSLLIGDKDSDLAAAAAVGVAGRKFTGGSLLDFLRETIAASVQSLPPPA